MTVFNRIAPAAMALIVSMSAAGLGAQQVPVAQEFEGLHFRSIGPATMSGRISDLAVYEANPAVYYAATAHSGLWKTTSGGATFEALFQNEGLISLGDVTISQSDPDLVWVGGGEANNRQTSSWGGGVYKSTDGGENFQHMGLGESYHINRIVIHPDNDNVVLVAAVGSLYKEGGDRGIFKTTNGGQTWTQVLSVDGDTGANDLVMSETNPDVMFASTYQRRRTVCCMNGGGPGSGVWKSTDGGDNWTRVTGGGFAEGPLGRIALDIFELDENLVYALVEGPGGGGRGGGAAAAEDAPPNRGVFRSTDGGATWEHRSNTNPRPMYFSQMRIDPNDPDRILMGGVGLHMSVDGGETFVTDAARSIHDDVHAIWINGDNPAHILIGNDGGIAVSHDSSFTWTFLPNLTAGLFYHVSYDMEYPYNICGGMQDNYNWCGPSAVRMNRGIMNYDWFQIQGGDGFVAIPDQTDSRWVYTESQNGNMTRRNVVTGESKSIRPSGANVVNMPEDGAGFRFNWDAPMVFSPHDPTVLIVAANHVFRSNDRGDSWTMISPDLTSNMDRDELEVMGVAIADVTIARNDGVSSWPTLISLAESPRLPGVIYSGADDGTVSVTRDNGETWQNISGNIPGLPELAWISEVVPSRFGGARVYVTVDDHRNGGFGTHMWMSTDFGETFQSISGNLSNEVIKTLTEDTRNPDVLYVGTETGIFVSLDRGGSWSRLQGDNFPTVRVDELTIHPRENALLVGTHGRSVWVLDDLGPIQGYAAAAEADAALFDPAPALQWKGLDNRNEEFWGHQFWAGENPPKEAVLQYYLSGAATDPAIRITDASGALVRELAIEDDRNAAGIQAICWDQRRQPIPTPDIGDGAEPAAAGGGRGGGGRGGGGGASAIPGLPSAQPESGYMPSNPCGGGGGRGGANSGPYTAPGTYNVSLMVDGAEVDTKPLTIVMDPEVQFTTAERARYDEILGGLHQAQGAGTRLSGVLHNLHASVEAITDDQRDDLSGDLEDEFDAFAEALEEVRVKFGVPLGQGGGGGGRGGFGRGGGGGAPSPNVLSPVGSVKNAIGSIWETPRPSMMRRAEDAERALRAAMREARQLIATARQLEEPLQSAGISITLPAAGGG